MQSCWYDWHRFRYSNVPWLRQWASHIMMLLLIWLRQVQVLKCAPVTSLRQVHNTSFWNKSHVMIQGCPHLSFWVLGFVDLPLVASLFIPFHKNHCFYKQSPTKSHVSEVTWLAHMIASNHYQCQHSCQYTLFLRQPYCWPVVQTSALMSEQSPFVYWRILTLGSSQKEGKWLSSLLKELMQAKVFSALLSPHLARPARTTQNIPEWNIKYG